MLQVTSSVDDMDSVCALCVSEIGANLPSTQYFKCNKTMHTKCIVSLIPTVKSTVICLLNYAHVICLLTYLCLRNMPTYCIRLYNI